MDYKETIDYLFSQLPMFQRVGNAAFKKDLSNTIAISEALNHPEREFKSIHVGGTNGKGSVSHSLASILQEQGYKVGLYTSPHLIDFRERIRINGNVIPEQYIIDFVANHRQAFEKIQPSFFEWSVGLAFDYFAASKVDFAIIEVGLGGRLDSTNIITPILSVITNISFDHQNLLGNTLEEIAGEKAGIIKANVPVVIGEGSGVETIFKEKAKQVGSPILFAEDTEQPTLDFDLKGNYQKANLRTILCTCEVLKTITPLTDTSVREGLKKVTSNTGLRGRWEILSNSPLTICDTGHNEAGIKLITQQLKELTYSKLHFVITMVNDKDISKVIGLLPKDAVYYISEAKIPRALSKELLAETMSETGLNCLTFQTIEEAIKSAQNAANESDVIFIGGSTFTVAEALELF
jgi:dihydrofolate synthase/folylpolyglutamate synthase